MKKNIYDLLNEIETDVTTYKKINITQLEEKKMMKKFKETAVNTKGTNQGYKKYIGVAAAAVIAFGAIGTIPTMATTNATIYKIASFLGMEKNLAPYESVIGQEVTKDGVTMILNEVIVSNDELYVSVTTKLDDATRENYIGPGGFVYINGEEINLGMEGEIRITEDGNGLALLKFPLGHMPEGELDVKVSLRTPMANVKRSSHWDYEFTANGDKLREETQVVNLEKEYDLGNGNSIMLHEYKANPLENTISFTESNEDHKWVDVRGTDEKGNEVVFSPSMISGGEGKLTLEPQYKTIVDEAESLTLAVYANDEQVGETFEVK